MDRSEKRKRGADAVIKRENSGKGVDGIETTATEEQEVEEFFAILKRIHVAHKYFDKKDNVVNGDTGQRRELTAPCFKMEDFYVNNGINENGRRKLGGDSGSGSALDLNLFPSSDSKERSYK